MAPRTMPSHIVMGSAFKNDRHNPRSIAGDKLCVIGVTAQTESNAARAETQIILALPSWLGRKKFQSQRRIAFSGPDSPGQSRPKLFGWEKPRVAEGMLQAGNSAMVSWIVAGAEVSAKSTEKLNPLEAMTRFYDAVGVLVDISDNPREGPLGKL